MDVFLKKAAVTGLFESETELEVDFIDGVNCIHGINGSGKTVFINLLVGVLNCQVEYLRRIQFKSATIFILKGDNKRPTKMFTVSRESELIRYHFHIELESKEPPEIMGRLALIRGIPNIESIIKKGENIEISLDEDAFDMNAYRVRHILQQYLSATYVPLLRGHESAAKKRHRMHEAENDPYVNMLASLQEDFSRRFGAAHSSVNLELERLKSQMFERLLFDDSDSTIRQDMEDLRTMTRTGAINDYSTEEREQLTKEISDANIKIPQRKIERHFSIWRDTQEDVISTLAKLNEAQNTSNKPNKSSNENYNEEIARLHDDYSKAYFKCLASIKFHRKFKLAIDDIKLAQKRKDKVLAPFRMFETQINDFLARDKKFKLGPSGSFEIYIRERSLPFSELSSGEKHILAILARVCLSAFDKNTLFIADEPELSLHLEWQRKIIPAIQEISPSMQIIVATHSPQVIPDNAKMIDIVECYKHGK